jgi:membrane protein
MTSDTVPRTHRRAPKGPTGLDASSWEGTLKRTVKEFKADDLTDWAAALTYYSVLSIFPALLAIVSILGLVGTSATDPILENVGEFTSGPARDIVEEGVRNLQGSQGGAGVMAILGILLAVWSSSKYVAAFMRASNSIYDVPEGRPFWKKGLVRFAVTLTVMVLLAASALIVVVSGSLAEQAGDLLGLGSTAVTVWSIAKWPVLVVIVALILALLYWSSPNVKLPGFRWVTPGGLLAVLLWMAASAGFAFFVANFGSYNKTYGTFAGVVIFLIWLWISNVAILLGAELDAELARSRQIEAGHPAEKEPFLEPRDTTKIDS